MKSIKTNNDVVLEVLISTMDRTSLSFVKKMFPSNELENLNLLIINQTKIGSECFSEYENIRVLNSYETGLSKSRNLALKNAIGDICLIADDDVEYVKGFDEIIEYTFNHINNASLIRFKIDTFTGKDYKVYPETSKKLITRSDIKSASSIEIAFKRTDVVKSNIEFNTLFGLGSYFKSGEEYLFLKDAMQKDLVVYFENKTIVKHALERSTSNTGSDNRVQAVSALSYIDFKNYSYLFLVKYLFHLLSNKTIGVKDIFEKFQVGIIAIKKYKSLTKTV